MAIRRTQVRESDGAIWKEGWHTATIIDAKYGEWQGSRYLDVYFKEWGKRDGKPIMNARFWEKVNKEDGSEFGITPVFTNTNTITQVLEDPQGKKMYEYDDDPINLCDKQLTVYLYRPYDEEKENNEGFPKLLSKAVPVESNEDDKIKFDAKSIKWHKSKAMDYYKEYVKKDESKTDTGFGEIVEEPTKENSKESSKSEDEDKESFFPN
jgi:hypothetical protein